MANKKTQSPEEKIFEMIDTKSTMEEFLQAFDLVIQHIKETKDLNEEQLKKINELANDTIEQIKDFNTKEWSFIQRKIESIKDGEPGKNYILTGADKMEIASHVHVPMMERIINTIETIKTEVLKDTAEETRDKLETLKGEARLDVSAIKGMTLRETKLTKELIERAISIVDNRTSFLLGKTTQLRTDVDSKVTGFGTHNIYVQPDPPSNPSLYDLWVDTAP